MKFSIANILLLVAIIFVALIAVVDRVSHAKRIAELNARHELEKTNFAEIVRVQQQAETLVAVGRWLSENDDFNWSITSLLAIRDLSKNAHVLNDRAEMFERHGSEPSAKLAGELLHALDCNSFNDFVERYKKMEKFLQFRPSAFTTPDSKEGVEMRNFIESSINLIK